MACEVPVLKNNQQIVYIIYAYHLYNPYTKQNQYH